jgi:hypothetical protein
MLSAYRNYNGFNRILTGFTLLGLFGAIANTGLLDSFFGRVQTTMTSGLKEIILWFGWWVSLIWTIYHYIPIYPLPLFFLFTFLRMKPEIQDHLESLKRSKEPILLAEPVDEFVIVEGYPKPSIPQTLVLTLEGAESTWSNPSSPSPKSNGPPPPTPTTHTTDTDDWVILP